MQFLHQPRKPFTLQPVIGRVIFNDITATQNRRRALVLRQQPMTCCQARCGQPWHQDDPATPIGPAADKAHMKPAMHDHIKDSPAGTTAPLLCQETLFPPLARPQSLTR